MGGPGKTGVADRKRPSRFSTEQVAEDIAARQQHLGADTRTGTYLDAEAMERFRIQLLDRITVPEGLAKVLGKWAHANLDVLFETGLENARTEVRVFRPQDDHRGSPYRIDVVERRADGDLVLEIKPDSPEQIDKGRRKVQGVYKPLYPRQTGRSVARAAVVTYSRKDLLLIAIATGYVDPYDPGLPKSWRQEVLKVFKRVQRTGDMPFKRLGFKVSSTPKSPGSPGNRGTPQGGQEGAAPEGTRGESPRSRVLIRDPRTGIVKRDIRRTRSETIEARALAAARRKGPAHSKALNALGSARYGGGGHPTKFSSAGIEIALAALKLLQRRTIEKALALKRDLIRAKRREGLWVAAFVTLEVPDVRDPLAGANPVPRFVVVDVAIETGATRYEAMNPPRDPGRYEARRPSDDLRSLRYTGRAVGGGPEPREGYHFKTLLIGTAPPLQSPDVAELVGRYRIATADESAQASPLALAREMTVLSGNLDSFAVSFSSLDSRHRRIRNGISSAPLGLAKVQHGCAFVDALGRDLYFIHSELKAMEARKGARIIILERFVARPAAMTGTLIAGSLVWKRTSPVKSPRPDRQDLAR